MSYFDDVCAWHRAASIPLADRPGAIEFDRMVLRKRLVGEEFDELADALDSEYLPEIAKEAADLIVTVLGTMAEMGIPFDAVWDTVHRSNMAKVGPAGAVMRDDGKVLKPEGWKPPDIAAVLAKVAS